MASAVCARLGLILWLACLLPLAPAKVAAGKASRLPGAWEAEVAQCVLRAASSSPEASAAALERTGGQQGASMPSLLSLLFPLPKSPRYPGGLPALLGVCFLPPLGSVLPWEACGVAGASTSDAWRPGDRRTTGRRGRGGPRLPGAQTGCLPGSFFSLKMPPYPGRFPFCLYWLPRGGRGAI